MDDNGEVANNPEPLMGRDKLIDAIYEVASQVESGRFPGDWEVADFSQYLDSLAALLGSIERTYANAGEPVPSDPWELMARAVRGARYYE